MKNVLVIGAGIAGIQASLDLADRGMKVFLVEKEPSIGGKMALLDKTFPTNDCSICILAPKMNECFSHENIEVLEYSEVMEVKGKAGDFDVKVIRKSKYVDVNKCTGCGDCMVKCPTKVSNKFNSDLDKRRAIYLAFPQSVPRKATIDKEKCIYLKKGKCGVCKKICKAEAIDYEMEDKIIELNVGAIIVAIGFDVYDPTELTEYGYSKYANVHTAMEYERLICASGPTAGHLHVAPTDKSPKTIAFIQCVGARDMKKNAYCCSVCCMHATKEAMLAYEHYNDIKTYIFFTDLRACGKGFYEYVKRGENDYNISYIRAKPGEIEEDEETKKLIIYYKEFNKKKVKNLKVDMIILSTALVPTKSAGKLANVLGLELDEYGFFKTLDKLVLPLDTKRNGILVSGYCEAPKDIPESVAQASGAAARAAEIIEIAGGE